MAEWFCTWTREQIVRVWVVHEWLCQKPLAKMLFSAFGQISCAMDIMCIWFQAATHFRGLSERVGAELILAGASFFSGKDIVRIVKKVTGLLTRIARNSASWDALGRRPLTQSSDVTTGGRSIVERTRRWGLAVMGSLAQTSPAQP